MRGVLWCSGSQPSQSVIDAVLDEGVPVFGVDAGADRAVESGIEVEEVLGDLDSVDLARWDRGLHELPDQSSSDLAKSISLLIERGFAEIDVVGIDNGRTCNERAVSHGRLARIHRDGHLDFRGERLYHRRHPPQFQVVCYRRGSRPGALPAHIQQV